MTMLNDSIGSDHRTNKGVCEDCKAFADDLLLEIKNCKKVLEGNETAVTWKCAT